MNSLKQRVLQLNVAAVVAAAVLLILVIGLVLLGAIGAEALLSFADVLGVVGIASPLVIAVLFALFTIGVPSAATYYGYRRFVYDQVARAHHVRMYIPG